MREAYFANIGDCQLCYLVTINGFAQAHMTKMTSKSAVVASIRTGRATRSVLMPDGQHILVLDQDVYQRGLKAANGKLGQMVERIKDKSGLVHGKRFAR